MVNAQEWLESQTEYNTKEKREKVKELNVSSQNLERDLNLKDFINLESLDCSNNLLTGINLNQNKRLKFLSLLNNDFDEQDLSFLSHLTNLEELRLGNGSEAVVNPQHFLGDLIPLENLDKLQKLDIRGTNIERGLEYLPESLKEFYCNSSKFNLALIKSSPYRPLKEEYKNKGSYGDYYDYQNWRADNEDLVNEAKKEKNVRKKREVDTDNLKFVFNTAIKGIISEIPGSAVIDAIFSKVWENTVEKEKIPVEEQVKIALESAKKYTDNAVVEFEKKRVRWQVKNYEAKARELYSVTEAYKKSGGEKEGDLEFYKSAFLACFRDSIGLLEEFARHNEPGEAHNYAVIYGIPYAQMSYYHLPLLRDIITNKDKWKISDQLVEKYKGDMNELLLANKEYSFIGKIKERSVVLDKIIFDAANYGGKRPIKFAQNIYEITRLLPSFNVTWYPYGCPKIIKNNEVVEYGEGGHICIPTENYEVKGRVDFILPWCITGRATFAPTSNELLSFGSENEEKPVNLFKLNIRGFDDNEISLRTFGIHDDIAFTENEGWFKPKLRVVLAKEGKNEPRETENGKSYFEHRLVTFMSLDSNAENWNNNYNWNSGGMSYHDAGKVEIKGHEKLQCQILVEKNKPVVLPPIELIWGK